MVDLAFPCFVRSEDQLCRCFSQSGFDHEAAWGGADGGETKKNRGNMAERVKGVARAQTQVLDYLIPDT